VLGRLRRWLHRDAPPFDPHWHAVLSREFGHWQMLDEAELARMETLVSTFLHDTRWEAANGFELNQDHQLVIAAQASMLLLGLDLDGYPQLTSVIVHPSTVRLHGDRPVGGGLHASGTQHLAGQAHYRGPVVLSWAAVRRGARFPASGQNVVYHEFAHQLDMLDGIIDGTPPLGDDEAARTRWVEVCTTAYDAVRAEGSPVLRPYAGTNPAEFFAVATEVFFTRPLEVRAHEPALYDELRTFFRQDPAARAERFAAAHADAPSDPAT
jgi:Mlc titration factor MtfA (ptsG expression regulator)